VPSQEHEETNGCQEHDNNTSLKPEDMHKAVMFDQELGGENRDRTDTKGKDEFEAIAC
jgi:hypothetical protein